jgi:hypothetical protein
MKSGGQLDFPYQHVDGYLTYTEPGHVSVVLRMGDRFSSTGAFSAYAGSYELKGDQIVHHVAVASHPQREGTDLVRAIRFEGNRLFLSPVETPPWMNADNASADAAPTLVWERIH